MAVLSCPYTTVDRPFLARKSAALRPPGPSPTITTSMCLLRCESVRRRSVPQPEQQSQTVDLVPQQVDRRGRLGSVSKAFTKEDSAPDEVVVAPRPPLPPG